MKSSKNTLRSLFIALGFIISIGNINATHIVGGEITYKYLGKDTFEVTLTMRRDCDLGSPEAQFDNPALLSIYDGRDGRVRIDLGKNGQIKIPFSDDDTLNTFIRSDCGFEGSQVCVHETKYVTKVRLPYNTRGYTIVYQRCCRNSSLNNIVEPLEAGSTYSVRIDRLPIDQTNNSPVFTVWPDIYICKDKELDFDHSATDVDGDSLVYKLWNPILGLTKEVPQLGQPYAAIPDFVPVEFLQGYSLDNLLGGTPLKIDPKTGRITAKPNMVGQFLVGVEVQEYRNGKYLGSVYRDFQYNVRVCALPPVANFTAPSTDCDGLTLTFDNTSTTATRYEWNFNYPGMDSTFKSKEATPTFTFPTAGIYNVQLAAIRGSDNCRMEVVKKVSVFDIDYNADFDFTTIDCGNADSLTIRLNDKSTLSDPQYFTQKYKWTLTQGDNTSTFEGPAPVIKISKKENVVISLFVEADNLCTSSITKNIPISDIILIPDFDISSVSCQDGETISLTLTDKSVYKGSNNNIATRFWQVTTDDGKAFASLEKSISFTIDRVGFSAKLIVSGNGCVDSLTKSYASSDFFPSVDIATSLLECQDTNTVLMFKPILSGMSTSVTVTDLIWKVNGDSINADSITVLIMGKNTVEVYLEARLSNGCSIFLIRSFSGDAFRPRASISVSPTICPDDFTVTYVARFTGSIGFVKLNWSGGVISDLQSSNENLFTFTIPKDSAYTVSVTAEYAKSCEASATASFTGGNIAGIKFVSNPLVLCAGQTNNLVANPNPAFTYTWSPTEGLDLTVPSNPIVTATVSKIYSVTVTDGVCTVDTTIAVNVLDTLRLAIIGQKDICDNKVSLKATGGNGTGTYQWSLKSDFSEIISTTDSLSYILAQDKLTFYVNYIGTVCNIRQDSIVVSNRKPIAVKDHQNIFCSGDKFTYSLVNAKPNEPFTIVWTSDSHIVSDLTGSNISIVTGEFENEPFTLFYRLSNVFGCEIRDSIVFQPSVRQSADWTFTNTECGKTEICFTISGNITGGVLWDFGIEGSTSDTSSLLAPCFTYPAFGKYTVMLTSANDICGFGAITKPIDVNNAFDLIGQDEILLCLDDTATISVKSDLPQLTIIWTDSLGNVVSNGPTYTFIPKQDQILILNASDNTGCTYSDTVKVKLNKNFPALSVDGPFTVCRGDTGILKAFTVDVSQYNITWSPNQFIIGQLNVANPLLGIGGDQDSFSLDFKVINNQGCSILGNVPVVIQTSPTADFTFKIDNCTSKEVCFESTTSASNGIKWDFGVEGSSSDTSILQAPCFTYPTFGKYIVSLKSIGDFCVFDDVTKSVDVYNSLDLFGQDEVLLCPEDTATISVKSDLPQLTITWSDVEGNVLSNGPVYTFIPMQNQVLILNAFDNSGCTYTDTVNVALNKNFPALSVDGPFTVCKGDTGVLKAFSVDVTQYNITWSQNQFIIGQLNVANPLLGIGGDQDSFSLDFKVINNEGCAIQGNVPVVIQTSPTADFTFKIDNCTSKEVCFESAVPAGIEIKWDFGVEGISSDTSNLEAPCFTYDAFGKYIVNLKSIGDFCVFDDVTKSVDVYNTFDLFGQDDVLLCPDDTATISVKSDLPQLAITWSDVAGNVVSNGPVYTFIPQENQVLILNAFDNSGCTYTDTVNVALNKNFPDLNVEGPFTVCKGDTGILKAFTVDVSQYDITWSQNQYIIGQLNVANPLLGISGDQDSFVLDFKVFNNEGCGIVGKAPVVIQSQPTADFTFLVDDCANKKVCFETLVPNGYEIKWDFGNGNATNDTSLNSSVCYTYPGAGTYPILLTPNGNFCRFPEVQKSLTLYELNDIVTPNISNVCLRDTFKTLVLENVPDFDIKWYNEAGTLVSTGRILEYKVIGSQVIKVVATDPNGCTYTDSISLIGINEFPQLEYLDMYPVCLGDTLQFPLFNTNENHIISILWEENSHLIGPRDVLNPMIGIEADDMEPFSIAFEATTQFGCILRDTIDFILSNPNVVSIDHKAIDCEEYIVSFSIIGQFQGFAQWDFGDPNKPTGNVLGKEATFTYSGPGTYVVTLKNISAFCNFPTVTKTIILRDGLVLFENDTRTVCKGESTQLSVPAEVSNLKYEWLDIQGNSLGLNRPITLVVNDPKSVVLMVVDDNGCVFLDTLLLSPFAADYVINMPPVFCLDKQVQVGVTFTGSDPNDYDFLWFPNDCIISGATTINPIVDVTKAKSLFVNITNKQFGCTVKDTVAIVPFTFNISVSASPDTVIDLFKEVNISVVNPQNGWTYDWSNGVKTATQSVAPEENTTYSVTVTDANGCTANAQLTIRVNPPDCEEDVFIPTAFTPNQDGVNDILYVRSNYIDVMELTIFNRWGQEVFSSKSVDQGWDGKFKGKELSPDAFGFYLKATCVDGTAITRRGNISLLR